jgi:cell shape-determining protein MreC
VEDVKRDRLGSALRRMAEDLVEERRTVALLRRENRELKEQLATLQRREAMQGSTADRRDDSSQTHEVATLPR